MIGVYFEIHLLNKKLNTVEMVLCFSSKVPFDFVWWQPNLFLFWRICSDWKVHIFRKISRVDGEIKLRRYFILQVKGRLLFTDHNQTNTNCSAWEEIESSGISERSRVGGEIERRRYFVLQVKCSSLLTDHDQTYANCSTCAVSERYGVWERSLKF